MNAGDRVLLLDLENLGMVRPRPRPLRARLEALLAVAGDIHHAVAAYALSDDSTDPVASLLAELRIAPLRVARQPDAAELALLAHARHVHAEGGRIFLVGSADGRFAELASLGRVELLVWDGQPVAAKLSDVVHDVHRLARPTGTPVDDTADTAKPDHLVPASPLAETTNTALAPPQWTGPKFTGWLLTALATGFTIAAGQRLFDGLVPRRKR